MLRENGHFCRKEEVKEVNFHKTRGNEVQLLNYITSTVTPLPVFLPHTHARARRPIPQLLRTCQRDDAGDVSPGILGDASVVAKVLLGQILHVQTHLDLHSTIHSYMYDPTVFKSFCVHKRGAAHTSKMAYVMAAGRDQGGRTNHHHLTQVCAYPGTQDKDFRPTPLVLEVGRPRALWPPVIERTNHRFHYCKVKTMNRFLQFYLVARLSLHRRHEELSPGLHDPARVVPEGERLRVGLHDAAERDAAPAHRPQLLVGHPHHRRN